MSLLTDILALHAPSWGIVLTGEQIAALDAFTGLLLETNRVMNLTAITDPAEIAIKHILDALHPQALAALPQGAHIIDVGSGAGFPGIPLAIARPDLSLVLLDSQRKRVDFLKAVCENLNLAHVTPRWGRAEEAARLPELREQFDVATARAVAPLPVLAEYLLPFMRVGGCMLAYKGPAARDEADQARRALNTLGAGSPRFVSYTLPVDAQERTLILADKNRSTPPAYPRKPGKPEKEPL